MGRNRFSTQKPKNFAARPEADRLLTLIDQAAPDPQEVIDLEKFFEELDLPTDGDWESLLIEPDKQAMRDEAPALLGV